MIVKSSMRTWLQEVYPKNTNVNKVFEPFLDCVPDTEDSVETSHETSGDGTHICYR